jgi:hypothetical protein
MTAIDNAVTLMTDAKLMAKLRAVSVYVARQVVVESGSTTEHAKRMMLAQAVIWNPVQNNVLFTNIVACDPEVCSGTANADSIPDATLIQKVTDLWTPVAQMLYPS